MRLQLPPFAFLRRHAWGLAVLCVILVVWFAGIGYVGEKIGADVGRAFKDTPVVDDNAHRAD